MGLEENLSVSQATGTLNMTIKLPFLGNRHDFNPPISLNYSSANGNSILGMGWDLGLPAIFRKTDRKIPEYRDQDDGDTYILAGQDDLVPYLIKDADGQWTADKTISGNLIIRRYRPRVEKSFLKIERIQAGSQSSWKVTAGNNTVTFFGLTDEGRIFDPDDSSRVWKWLPQLCYDNLGNLMQFSYKQENLENIGSQVCEKTRQPVQANRYLKRILYGNSSPFYPDDAHGYSPVISDDWQYYFDIVMDYGDQDDSDPYQTSLTGWPIRSDSFSTFRPGFEVRTRRMVKRILFFNCFKELSGDGPVQPVPVKSMDFSYRYFGGSNLAEPHEADYLTGITESSWRRRMDGSFAMQSLPTLKLGYSEVACPNVPGKTGIIRLNKTNLDTGYLLVDYENEGLPGILFEKPEGLYYSSNLGGGDFSQPGKVLSIPAMRGLGDRKLEIGALDPGGRKFLVTMEKESPGFYEQDPDGLTIGFTPFKRIPNVEPNLVNHCYIDLNGDGLGELAVFGDGKLVFYPNNGRNGFGDGITAILPEEAVGEPQLIWSSSHTGLFLADMNGDGLTDIVLISHRAVSYWPNIGYGRFGTRIQMDHAPILASADAFNPDKVLLADLTGSGTVDIAYTGGKELIIFLNACGNAFLDGMATHFYLDRSTSGRWHALDLFGSGMEVLACRNLNSKGQNGFVYFDLMDGAKPYILTSIDNQCGRRSTIAYRSSTFYYLEDKHEGVPWVLRLPFPVLCVAQTTTQEMTTGLTVTRNYRYRHGSYDGYEREFKGFGLVEMIESEALGQEEAMQEPIVHAPLLTRTWHHIGTEDEWPAILARYKQEFYQDSSFDERCSYNVDLQTANLADCRKDRNDAWRALKFAVLRQETFGLDDSEQSLIPYVTTATSRQIRAIQPAGRTASLSAMALEMKNALFTYERKPDHPRVTEVVNVLFDEHNGMILENAVTSYGSPPAEGLPADIEKIQHMKQTCYTVYRYTNPVDNQHYRLPQLAEKVTYELFVPAIEGFLDASALQDFFASAPAVDFLVEMDCQSAFKRKLSAERILYYTNDLKNPLILGIQEVRGAVYRRYSQVFDHSVVSLYHDEVSGTQLEAAGYTATSRMIDDGLFTGQDDGGWWTATERLVYGPDPLKEFCLPRGSRDYSGKTEQIGYFADYYLVMSSLTDAMGIRLEVTDFDMRLLRPTRLVDRNRNVAETAYDIFGSVAVLALQGKGNEADSLAGVSLDLSQQERAAFFSDPLNQAVELLGPATERYVCNYDSLPIRAARIVRETHQGMLQPGQMSRILVEITYFDGFGQVLSTKKLSEPGQARILDIHGNIGAVDTGTACRWLTSGRTLSNNKGKPYLVYEPYFSVTHQFDTETALYKASGLTRHVYDPPGRSIWTHYANGTSERSVIEAWQVVLYDRNDLVAGSSWLFERQTGVLANDPYEKAAADKTLIHADTPSIQHLDCRGRPILLRSLVKTPARPSLSLPETVEISDIKIKYNAAGNRTEVTSPRSFSEEKTCYDMVGQVVSSITADAGSRRMLYDADFRICHTWDGRGCQTKMTYDDLDRVVAVHVLMPDMAAWRLTERIEYGESLAEAYLANQLGQVVRHYDQSGLVVNQQFDFKGNILTSSRQFFAGCEQNPDWDAPPPLGEEIFDCQYSYNALNLPLQQSIADGSTQAFSYDLDGMVRQMSGRVKGLEPVNLVTLAEYNERGQRTRIQYANGAETVYTYEPKTMRLKTCTSSQTGNVLSRMYQNMVYTYDPVGNISSIKDLAGETVFFDGGCVSPETDYYYDSLYRLVIVNGREHEGQNLPGDPHDTNRTFPNHHADGSALRRYREHYFYDLDGNMEKNRHTTAVSAGCWTKEMVYALDANHLLSESTGGSSCQYAYDESGHIRQMPHLEAMKWNDKGLLVYSASSAQQYSSYAYDAGGQRTRKVTHYANGIIKERIYCGFFELYREYSGSIKTHERQTLCFHDGSKVFAEIDVDAAGLTGAGALCRYRLDSHLQSNLMELDSAGRVISYEEYYPFGGTAFKATRSFGVEVPMSRYRYLGKERDEETGFYYFGLRYYAPWLGRWLSPDPKASNQSHGLYIFLNNNPLRYTDPDGGRDEDEVDGTGQSTRKDDKGKANESKKEEEKEKPSVQGVILSSIQVLKGASLMVLGIINGDNWLKIIKKVYGVVKDLWDYLGYLSDEIANWQKNTIDAIIDFAKNKIWKPIKDFFVDLWARIVRFFSPSDDAAGTADKPDNAAATETDKGIDVDFDVSASSSGVDLTLKIGESEWALSIGEGLKLKGKIDGYEFAYGMPWTFDELTYDYGGEVNEATGQTEGRLAKSEGTIKFSLDQYPRKNSTVFKMPFYWLNYYRNRAVYQGSPY